MAPLRPVSAEEIESLAIGAWILGTGGGGSPYLALLNMRALYRQGAVVSLIDPLDLADDDLVAVVSNMGAPLVGQERLTDPRTIASADTCKAPRKGKEVRECGILYSTSKAIRLGQTVRPPGARIVIRSRRSSRRSAANSSSPARSPTWPGAPPKASCGGPRASTASATAGGNASSSPSRTSSRWAGSTARRVS